MIKTVGFGKKRIGMSLIDAQNYHIQNHAPFGKRVAQPLGMSRYMGYYPHAAYDLQANTIAELPWDFVVPEYFSDDFFQGIGDWRENTEDGREITLDEARFCDRDAGCMMTCEDNILLANGADAANGHYFIVLLSKHDERDHDQCIAYHRDQHCNLVAALANDGLLEYTAYYVNEVYGLADGDLPQNNPDIILQLRTEHDFKTTLSQPQWQALLADLASFCDVSSATVMACTRHSYVV